jgi:hypothetical protein
MGQNEGNDKNKYPRLVKQTPHYHKGMLASTSLQYEVEEGKFIHTTSGLMGCLTEHERDIGCIAFEVLPPWLNERIIVVKDDSGKTPTTE